MISSVERSVSGMDAAVSAPAGPAAVGPAVELPGPRPVILVPVASGDRAVGAYVLSDGMVRYQPVVDLRQVLSVALAAVAVTALGAGVAVGRRRVPAVGTVTMGPGGWVSLKGVTAPALRSGHAARPFWARLLRARRLVVER